MDITIQMNWCSKEVFISSTNKLEDKMIRVQMEDEEEIRDFLVRFISNQF